MSGGSKGRDPRSRTSGSVGPSPFTGKPDPLSMARAAALANQSAGQPTSQTGKHTSLPAHLQFLKLTLRIQCKISLDDFMVNANHKIKNVISGLDVSNARKGNQENSKASLSQSKVAELKRGIYDNFSVQTASY